MTELLNTVTRRFIEEQEKDGEFWAFDWSVIGLSRPLQFNGRAFRGLDTLILWDAADTHRFTSPYWLTAMQIWTLGGRLRAGERATRTVSGEVFNACQVDGLTAHFYPSPRQARPVGDEIAEIEAFHANTGADIRYDGLWSFYDVKDDYIQVNDRELFKRCWYNLKTRVRIEDYPHCLYRTVHHELMHWTMPEHRCNRFFPDNAEDFLSEELMVHWGCILLDVEWGVIPYARHDKPRRRRAWRRRVKDDPAYLPSIIDHAERAFDYLMGFKPDPSVQPAARLAA